VLTANTVAPSHSVQSNNLDDSDKKLLREASGDRVELHL